MYKELHYSISYSVCMCVNVHLYVGAHVPICVSVCVCMLWMPEINLVSVPQAPPTLLFEARTLTALDHTS